MRELQLELEKEVRIKTKPLGKTQEAVEDAIDSPSKYHLLQKELQGLQQNQSNKSEPGTDPTLLHFRYAVLHREAVALMLLETDVSIMLSFNRYEISRRRGCVGNAGIRSLNSDLLPQHFERSTTKALSLCWTRMRGPHRSRN